jgi:zinc protease
MNRICPLVILFVWLVAVPQADAAQIKPIRTVTTHGITLLVLPRPSIPLVSLQLMVKAGSAHDPEGQSGLANLTTSLLEQGTKQRSATQIAETLDAIGARLSVEVEEDFTVIKLQLLKKEVETGLTLLADILMNPAFSEEEIARARRNMLSNIAAEADQPEVMAERRFRQQLFAGHPYQHPVIGQEKTVAAIKREDIVAFHRAYFRPNNTIVAVVGDVTEAEAATLLKKHFSTWEKGRIPTPKQTAPAPIRDRNLAQIDKPELTQATVILGHIGIPRSHPDYYAVSVMNYILGGGGFSSRMMGDVRDAQGLVYSIYSLFDAKQATGSFFVSLQTKNESVGPAVDAVLAQIKRIQGGLVSETELSETQGYLTGSFPLRMDTTAKAAALLAAIEFHQLGLDYFEKYPRLIRAVTREDVLRVAKMYLDPAHYAMVVVSGKPSK